MHRYRHHHDRCCAPLFIHAAGVWLATNFVVVVSVLLAAHCEAANWAQVSGERHTNAAVLEATPWTKRHGHAVAALDFSDAHVRATGQQARLFVIGGDSSVQGKQDLRAYPGGGGFKNDVWATTGIHWRVESNILKTTKWGEPLPQIIANVTWQQTNAGKRPPRGVTYSDWTACAAAAWAVHPVAGCNDASKPPGAYLADNMWSPRRDFVATAFGTDLVVLGGRAREHAPVPEDQLRGGTSKIEPRNVRWREFAVLKNDVWRSSDAGASWQLVTPGCAMPQASLVHKAGRQGFVCATSDDCDGDSSCAVEAGASVGTCVCNMWSPRELHAVAILNNSFILTGGYALVELGNCGVDEYARKRPSGDEFACSGGYRAYMHDVWRSRDGQHWELLTLAAAFAPRGEHAMAVFQSTLFVFGGRTATTLLNDVWTSADGVAWRELAPQAPWSVRAKHVIVVLPGATDPTSGDDPDDTLVLMYGEDDERTLDDVWTWKGERTDWVRDYAPATAAAAYVSPTSNVEDLRTMTEPHAAALHNVGVDTIADLSTLTTDQTLALRNAMPICDYIALAKQVVATCTVSADVVEGHEFGNQLVAAGPGVRSAYLRTGDTTADNVMTAETWDGCTHIGTMVLDASTKRLKWPDVRGVDQVQTLRDVSDDAQLSVCKWHPAARTGHAAAVFQRQVIVLGGLTQPDYFVNDVWYRDARRPRAQLTLVPRTASSDTRFAFVSDKRGCVFEYHVTNIVEQLVVRNWTRALGEVDVLNWLDGGTYRFRVRAVDAAGNVDAAFEPSRNEHVWVYVPKLPWPLIIGLASTAAVLLLGFGLEWRKRRKRAAMERYAMKRMRRKLKGKKAETNGDANWRATYDAAKDTDAKKTKKKTKGKVVGVKDTVAGKKVDKDKDKKVKDKKVKDKKVKDKKTKDNKKDKTKDKTGSKDKTATKDKLKDKTKDKSKDKDKKSKTKDKKDKKDKDKKDKVKDKAKDSKKKK